MACQRPHFSLDELSKKVAEDVGLNIVNLFDRTKMARGVLDALGHYEDEDVGETFGDYVEVTRAEGAIEVAVADTCDDEEVLATVTEGLKEAEFTNDPPAAEAPNVGDKNIVETVAAAVRAAVADLRPQPSVLSADVTALREQILTNCRAIHSLHGFTTPPGITTDIFTTSADGHTNFRALVGCNIPGVGLLITIETPDPGYATSMQALEYLYKMSCFNLSRCRTLTKEKGGKLGDWKYMHMEQQSSRVLGGFWG